MKLYRTPLNLTAVFLLPAVLLTATAEVTTTNLSQEHQWVSLSAVNNVVWAGSNDGYVALSRDAGHSFEVSRLSANANLQELNIRQLIVIDDHHGYALTTGAGERSGLYITRNGGFSWRPLYQGEHHEQLRCMAINPDGEAWILGDSQNEHWHVVRSNNGRHWSSSRSGFAKRSLPGEQASNTSDSCVRFENNTWLMGTQNADIARIMHKQGSSLRFQVTDTPMVGVSAVWPLTSTTFILAGGNANKGELYAYNDGEFDELKAPAMTSTIEVLFKKGDRVYIGNSSGIFMSPVEDLLNGHPQWNSVFESIGARSFTCSADQCWLLGSDNQLYKINP